MGRSPIDRDRRATPKRHHRGRREHANRTPGTSDVSAGAGSSRGDLGPDPKVRAAIVPSARRLTRWGRGGRSPGASTVRARLARVAASRTTPRRTHLQRIAEPESSAPHRARLPWWVTPPEGNAAELVTSSTTKGDRSDRLPLPPPPEGGLSAPPSRPATEVGPQDRRSRPGASSGSRTSASAELRAPAWQQSSDRRDSAPRGTLVQAPRNRSTPHHAGRSSKAACDGASAASRGGHR